MALSNRYHEYKKNITTGIAYKKGLDWDGVWFLILSYIQSLSLRFLILSYMQSLSLRFRHHSLYYTHWIFSQFAQFIRFIFQQIFNISLQGFSYLTQYGERRLTLPRFDKCNPYQQSKQPLIVVGSNHDILAIPVLGVPHSIDDQPIQRVFFLVALPKRYQTHEYHQILLLNQ